MDEFHVTLLRYIAAQMHFSMCMSAAHELFGKPFFELSGEEVAAVSKRVGGHVWEVFKGLNQGEFAKAANSSTGSGVIH